MFNVSGLFRRGRLNLSASVMNARTKAVSVRPPYRRSMLFESLEPRLLLSADLVPEVAVHLQSGLNQFRDWTAALSNYEELGQQLPVVSTALGSAVDLSGWLQTTLLDPVQTYLSGAGSKTTDGLVGALAGVAGLSAVTGDQYGNEIRFDLVLDASRTLNGFDLSVPQTANGMAITAGGGALDLTASMRLDFAFGVDLTPGLSVDDAFFLRFDSFSLSGDIHANNLNFDVSVGFLGASVVGGSVNMDADLQVLVANPDADPAGYVTLGELRGTTLQSLVTLDGGAANVSANLPITITELGGFNPGSVQVAISGNPFTGVAVNLTGANAAEISNFGRLTPFAVTATMNRIAQWLSDVGNSPSVFGQDVPFAGLNPSGSGNTQIKDLLDFSSALKEVVNDFLVSAPGVPDFNNAQEFATRLSTLLGLDASAISAGYNTSSNQLTFFFRLDHSFANLTAPVNLNLNLAPLGGLNTTSTLEAGADGRLQFTLGFDLSPFEAFVLGNLLLPANGVLSANAVFQVAVNGAAPVAVTVNRQAGNTNRNQLVANVNTALADAGVTNLTASLVSNKLQFKASGDMFGASVSVFVSDPLTNTAKTELGLNEVMADTATAVSRAFVRDMQISGDVHVSASDIDASANFGFIGVDIVNGTATAQASVLAKIRNPSASSAPVRVGDFFTAITNLGTWAQLTTSGTASANLPVQVQGDILPLGADPRVMVTMSNVFKPSTLSVSFPDLTALTNYKNLDIDTVLGGLSQFVTYLGSVEGFSFLNLDLPVIDKSVSDLLSFIPRMSGDIADLQALGVPNLQTLEARIEQAFGLAPSELVMTFADNDLRFGLHLSESLPAQFRNLHVNLDLAKLAGYVGGGAASNLAGVGKLIDVGGSADLSVTGSAVMDLTWGFDLANPNTPRAYIHDDSTVNLLLKVSGNNLDFDAAVGPLGLFIRNGVVDVSNGLAPAAFGVAFKPATGDRWYSNQWNTSILTTSLVGQASATLPVYFPLESNFAGDIALNIGNLANIGGTTTLSAPNLAAEIGSIDLFSDMGSLIQGLDLLLAGIEDALDGEIFGINLPIVGHNLKDAANFMTDLRAQIVPKLELAFAGGDKGAIMVRNALFDVLGNADVLGDGGGFLDIILDRNNDGVINADDVGLRSVGGAGNISEVQFDLRLGQSFVASVPIGFDLGLPGLGLQASDNSAVQVAFTYAFNLGLGVSRQDGVYIDTSSANEMLVTIDATTPNMAIGGELAFLRLKIEDDASKPTHLSGNFTIDLKDPVGSNNRLTFNELASGLNFSQVVDVTLDLQAEANLKLTAGVMGSSNDVASAAFLDPGFPQLLTDFHLLWEFGGSNGFNGDLQDVSFNNVQLNLGQFLNRIVNPIVNTINPILEPIRPILDVLNARIPVISDITGKDITFIEMARQIAPELVSAEAADFIAAAGDLVDFLDRLDTLGDDVFIDFGSFNLNSLGAGQDLRNGGSVNFGGIDFTGRKTDPDQALTDQLASKSPGFNDAKNDIKGTGGSGFAFPLLDDPTLAFKLLLGQDVDIFRYDMPEFSVGFDIEQAFGPVYAPPAVYVTLEGGLRAGIRFSFGYDTHGIRSYAESIDEGTPNALLLFDGFYVADTYDVGGGVWEDKPELFLQAHIGAGVRVSAVILSLEVEGGIYAELGLNLHDIDGDGKMRQSEFLERIQGGGPLCVFDFEGEFGAYLELELRIGIDLGIFFVGVTIPVEIARVTLVSFSVDCDAPPPILATLDETDGILYLNMGDRAADRLYHDVIDGDESFRVTAVGGDSVLVEAFGFTQLYGSLQAVPAGNPPHAAITRIIANGGLGNDVIEIDSGVLHPVELSGGDGDDIIIAGGGMAFIQGGAGRDTLKGGSRDDRIYGHSESGAGDDNADDILEGRGGNDKLYGQGGNDQIDGGAGDDELYGGDGDDTLFGGAGDDWLYGGNGFDLLYGEQGNDVLQGGAGVDWLYGGSGDDMLHGHGIDTSTDDGAADILYGDLGTGHIGAQDRMGGDAGDDVLYGNAGNDLMFGEGGNDVLFGGLGDDEMHGNAGNDVMWGEGGADLMRGGSGNDILHGGDGGDHLYGDSGDDTLYGDAGDDFIWGGTGRDEIHGGDGNDTVRGQEGDDRIYGEAGADVLYGDAGDDLILGGDGDDLIVGGLGADRLYGGRGNDAIYGGAGDDQLYGEEGNDTLFGNAGRDRLYGGVGNDVLHGNEGDDHLLGEDGDDVLYGDDGDDLLEGGVGADTLRGGAGNDVLLAGVGLGKLLYGDDGDDIIVGSDSGGDDDNLFDTIYFGDRIFGGAGRDRIWGLGGADIIDGGDGDDEIWGGEHGDLILGQDGSDRLYGGFGSDHVFGGTGGDLIDGGLDADWLYGEAGDDEILGGGGVGDQLWGGAGDDVLRGSDDGGDILYGGAGHDRLYGNGGNDHLLGGAGDDILEGNDGDDLLEGGAGSDVLVGGAQHDRLYGHSVSGADDGNSVDWLYGDFGTNGDEAGSGNDQLFGQGGNDLLFGEGGDDLIQVVGGAGNGFARAESGGGGSNVVDFGSGEGATPGNFVVPTPTLAPTPVSTRSDPMALAALPTGPDVDGLWRELAGSASGAGVSGGGALALEPAVATDALGRPVLAWADARNGNFEIYLLRHNGSAWEMLGASAAGGGISATAGSSRQPSLAFDADGSPVVAWVETVGDQSDVRVARFNAAANGGAGAWVQMGNSLAAGGISNSGDVSAVQLVSTTAGVAAVWLDDSSGTTQVYARRFDGAAWAALGATGASGAGVSGAASDVSDLSVASDGTRIAVGWTRTVSGAQQVFARQFDGGAWLGMGGSDSGGGVSDSSGNSSASTLAYAGGDLFMVWQHMEDGYQNLRGEHFSSGDWSSVGALTNHGPTTDNAAIAKDARLASGGGAAWLFWTDEDTRRSDQPQALYATRWDGAGFTARMPADADGDGISETGGRLSGAAVAVDATGCPVIAWSDADRGFDGDPAVPQIYLRADAPAVNRIYQVADLAELQGILDTVDLATGDFIVLGAGNFGGFTITAQDSGVTLVGAPGGATQITGAVTVDGATNVRMQGLRFSADVTASNADGFTLRDSHFLSGKLVLAGGDGVVVVHNRFGSAGVQISAAGSGDIAHNDISGTLDIDAAFAGAIAFNDIHGADIGVDYGASAALRDNRIWGNTTGIRSTVAGTVAGLGFAAGAGVNHICDNSTGIVLVGAQVQDQHVYDNATGVSGTGIVGGTDLARANLIEGNDVGVSGFTGTVQYSRIAGNDTGIVASNGLKVWHNLIYRNADFGLLASGVADIRIYQNTFYAPLGDNIRLQGGSSNVEVRGNILWARSGYDIFVANDSQSGFFSDYNNLYADEGGRIGYWTRDFDDLIDWQADIARFDLHSIGATAVNPLWAKPQFRNTDFDDFRLFEATAGLRFTSPDVEGADARLDQGLPPHYQNLLDNPGFESGLAGWTVNTGAAVKASSPVAYEGSQYFAAGNVQTGQAQQTVDLLAKGFTVQQLDSGALDLVYGARMRSAAENPADRGSVSVQFFDALSNPINLGNATATALNTSDRWELVGGRTTIPASARFVVIRFLADRSSGSSNDAWLDGAFLNAVSQAYIPDLGAYGHATHEALASVDSRILLRFPDMYTDWEKAEPLTIRWETVNNISSSPVRIDLVQDTADGPAFVLNIALGTADDGEFIWIPGNSGIDFGTHGLRIQVSLVHDMTVIDRSQESFSVPEDGGNYYVDDDSDVGDQFTLGATGSNRHTGKSPDAPKPNAVNVLREYQLDSFSTLHIDAGNYPMIYSMAISGSVDFGLGLDEGFLITGPDLAGAGIATLFPAIPGNRTWALIDLHDADFMTIRHLSLRDADRGLYVHDGSDAFAASWITAWGHDQDGIRIDTQAPFATLDHLTAYGNTRYGIHVTGVIASLSNSDAHDNGSYGIYMNGGVDLFADNVAHGNQNWGMVLSQVGNSQILSNEAYGNRYGMSVSNSTGTAWVGDLNLDAGNGNQVHDNTYTGLSISGSGVRAAGNSIWGHTTTNYYGLDVNSGSHASYNLVFGNYHGISAYSTSGAISYNRVYDNSGTGINASYANLVGNVVYSNARGIVWGGSGNYSARNNLVYGNDLSGITLSGSGLQLINNTVLQLAGNSVDIDNASNIGLFNNILWSDAGYALAVSSNSQVGFASDYNLFFTTGTGQVGQWQGAGRSALNSWRAASFSDANSLYADPLFVDLDGADGILGFVSSAADGRDDDFHLRSVHGSAHGGSLAPVRDAASGLPVAMAITDSTDLSQSPGIDRGRASDDFSLEPQANGGFINMGAYGGTAQASLSPAQYITVFAPNGGESVPQETNYEIRWRAHGFAGNVDIAVSDDSGGSWTPLADSEVNDGSFNWDVGTVLFAAGTQYLVRVTAEVNSAISDRSDQAFTVTGPINIYYVNLADDVDFSDNEYTTAAGSDMNDGLSAATPMASIRAVLERYDLDAGDTIVVDTGTYLLTTNISIGAQDSGVVIRGATQADHVTRLERGNTTSSSYILQLAGADDVTLDHLSMTGAYHAVVLASGVDSDRITISNSAIYHNANHGVNVAASNEDFTLVASNVYENGSYGVYTTGLRGRITDNVVYGNGSWGINASVGSAPAVADWIEVSGNRVFNNGYGISGSNNVRVLGNEVWSQSQGISVDYGALAQDNDVWGNTTGIQMGSLGTARDNRVWGNTGVGINGYNSLFEGNRVYGNNVGIVDTGYGQVLNNLVYDNTVAGIRTTGGHTAGAGGVVNNTVRQAGGRAIEVSSSNVTLRNNMVWSEGGIGLYVASDSQGGFASDYNLFHLTGGAQLGWWEGRAFDDRTDWYYETGFDAHSLSADPRFVDVDGADGTPGWNGDPSGFSQVLDDEDAGHVFTGTWSENSTKGYAGDFWQTPAGGGSTTSSWSFTGLQAGYYRIAVTWPYDTTASSAGNAGYTVRDGADTVLAYQRISHNYARPNDFDADGASWETVGMAHLQGDTLVVTLSDYASARVFADAVRIERITGDFGSDDDYHLQSDSPAIDRGDLNDSWLLEPLANGARVNLGAYGGTVQATQSFDQLIQLLTPNGLEKYEVGQAYQIDWRSSGLAQYDPAILINTGNAGAVQNWLGNVYQTQSYSTSNISTNAVLDLSGAADTAPEAVYRSYAYAQSVAGSQVAWTVPAEDGHYRVRLHFSEPSNIGVGTRKFDISLNGVLVADDYDVRALAGAYNKAVVFEYDVNLSGGTGLLLELLSQSTNAGYPAFINGIELLKVNGAGVQTPTADLQVSLDNGATWEAIASGLTMDRYGNGSYLWTPTQQTAGNTALIRALGHAGAVVVQDVSDEAFLVANGGQSYYVNVAGDVNFGDNEFTSAAGDNANSGKTLDAPMASLAALLRAYDLDAGDVIYVDTGVYSLATNIVLDVQDSGVTIQGPQVVGHVAELNRGNTASGRVVFELAGADDVTLANLAITGGQYGIYAGNVDSDRITVRVNDIHGNTSNGVSWSSGNDDWLLEYNQIHGNGARGVEMSGARGVIQGNDVFGNASYGIYTTFNGADADRAVVRDNRVHNNSNDGIVAYYDAWVVGNQVYGHTNNNLYGIVASSSNVLVEGNDVYGNYHGLSVSNSALVRGNEIYGNAQSGIVTSSSGGADIVGNRIYGNSVGIVDGGYTHIVNNVIYANTNVGISLSWYHSADDLISNNTIYQPVGDAIRVTANARDVRLFNNVLWVAAGYGINADPGGLTGLLSDYNLIFTAGAAARTGLWNNLEQVTLANWQLASARDVFSVAGDPLFLDIDGADNVLGANPASEGDGHDDNFGLKAYSPAIDAANAYRASRYDIEGRDRHDDPSSSNTGDGWPLYVPDSSGGNLFVAGGTARPYQTSQGYFNQTLPFAFDFYGTSYTQVAVSTEGYLQFAGPDSQVYQANSLEVFQRNAIIAPFWDNLTTAGTGRNIFIDQDTAGQITFRWSAAAQTDTSRAANFSVTLFADGRFRFDYGAGNSGFTPRVGVSAGNGFSFVLAPAYDGSSNLASGNSLSWQAQPGLNFYDIGAYEFQGDSSDATPPLVTAITQLPPDGGTTALAFASVQVNFSESLDGISARSPANYELLSAGADGVLDTADDIAIVVTPAYSFPETDLTLQFGGGVLADGLYRLRLSGTLAIFDTAGNALDGDANGSAGGDYLHVFTVDRSSNTDPVADAQAVSVDEDGSIVITLGGVDADGDALSFGLFSNPVHGSLSGFDPVARTVIYTPDADYWGADSFQFQVDDGKLGTDTATISVTVLPVNDAPQAPGQVVNLSEDNPVVIVLPASDKETPRSGLVFTLVTPPSHGALVQGANGSWTYTPALDFAGDDSFVYTVTDRGGNDADPGTALTSAQATITLIVNPTNDPPVLDEVPDQQVDEGSLLTVQLAGQDPENQSLIYSLVSGPAGVTVDAGSGLLRWTPADGDARVDISVQVSDGVHMAQRSFTVDVANVAPTLGVSGAAEVAQGDLYPLALTSSDPGDDTIVSWEVNWGDGNVETFVGSASSASHTYALDGDYAIAVQATDEDGSYDATPVLVSVVGSNNNPVVSGQFVQTDEDQPLVITLAASDPDGDTLSYSVLTSPASGTLSAIDPVTHTLTYTPAADFAGQVSFMFRVIDGRGGSATASIDIKVLPVNDAPTALAQTVATDEDTPLAIQLAGTDIETASSALLFNLVSGPAHGSLTLSPQGAWTYLPDADFFGSDSFQFSVTDAGQAFSCGCGTDYVSPALTSLPATVAIDVLPVNDDPVAADDSYNVHAGQTLDIAAPGLLGNDSDVDADTLAILAIDPTGLQGVLTHLPDGSFSFTPNAGFIGQTSFGYRVTDGAGGTDGATVTIDVQNAEPVIGAVSDQVVLAGESLLLAIPGSDPDAGDVLTYSLLSGPAGAAVDAATGELQWIAPFLDAIAVFPVSVSVSDGLGGQAQVDFNVTVNPDLLVVTDFAWTETGYTVRFNHAIDPSTLNLYDGQGANRGAADMVLRDALNKPVPGSIVVDADAMGLTFVKTGSPTGDGLLSPGAYNLTLDSRPDAFVDIHGRLLDGDSNGVAGGGFSASHTQAGAGSAFVSIGEFTRGAGQDVHLPASGAGIPVRIGNAVGASSVSFTLHYDSSLLDITSAVSNLPGVTVTTDLSVAGQISIQVTGITELTGAATELVHLTATVPATAMARYGQSHVLDLRDVAINGGAIPVRDDDGLHVAAYLADATGDGAYAADDSQAVLDAISRKYSGFGAYPLADPLVVAGAFGNGRLSVFDVRLIGNVTNGVAQAYIPALPVLPALAATNDLERAGSAQGAAAEVPLAPVTMRAPEPEAPVRAPAVAAIVIAGVGADQGEAAEAVPVVVNETVPVVVPAAVAAATLDPVQGLPELTLQPSSLDLAQYRPDIEFVIDVANLSAPQTLFPSATSEDRSALATDAAAVLGSFGERGREARAAAGTELRVRFDRRARLIDADTGDARHTGWLQNWVSGRDAHVARKSADWRVVLPR